MTTVLIIFGVIVILALAFWTREEHYNEDREAERKEEKSVPDSTERSRRF